MNMEKIEKEIHSLVCEVGHIKSLLNVSRLAADYGGCSHLTDQEGRDLFGDIAASLEDAVEKQDAAYLRLDKACIELSHEIRGKQINEKSS